METFITNRLTERILLPALIISACLSLFIEKTFCQTTGDLPSVDVALNGIVTAEYTCGAFGPEAYFSHSQIFLRPKDRVEETCQNTSVHPPSAMVNGNLENWWQSVDRVKLINAGLGLDGKPQATILIDLEQYFEVDRIIIRMGASRRPGGMKLLRSVDGEIYDEWMYRIEYEENCMPWYGVLPSASPKSLDSYTCTAYRSRRPATQFEPIQFDLTVVEPEFAAWRNLRFLKIEFYNMSLTLGINGVKFQHFTVSQLQIFAECVCNGQAETCAINNQTGKYQCVCSGNTTGINCEMCDPFFNQFAFKYGQPCEKCNCFEHADGCFYDAVTENFNRSMDVNGDYRGGGVCMDCRDNTTGVNCEKCLPNFYRPLGVEQKNPDVCVPCDCHGPGVDDTHLTSIQGHCIINDDDILPLGMQPGDCVCKSNVTGSKCDTCKVGFYDLREINPYGCTDCGCDTRGTVEGTPICNFTSGQCPCKVYVMGKHCEECHDGFYGMTTDDVNGCKQCLCDDGASQSEVCEKELGQCPCRKNIDSRECKKPDNSSYFPDPHFLHGEFESILGSWARLIQGYSWFGYATLSESVRGTTEISLPADTLWSGEFYLIFRYESRENITGEAFVLAAGRSTIRAVLSFPVCAGEWCYYRYGQDSDTTIRLIDGRTYTIQVSVSGKLNLDQVIFLPVQFTNATTPLAANAEQFHKTCNVYTNDMRLGTQDESFCLENLFSMTAYYLNGALPCGCHDLGTVPNTTCDQYGGQCQCQPGTSGRKCDDCQLEYYDLQEGGCRPCGCGSDYKVCDSLTGNCVCPPNIIGRKCDRCLENHWNWTAAYGCEPCECDPIGSTALQCNLTTGVCSCKTGVLGPRCHECEDGYRTFSWTGCEACGCDLDGSLSDVCDELTGQCPCKSNSQGQLCNQCKAGTFNLEADHMRGCLECVCMGITQQCTSSPWRLKTVEVSVISPSPGNRTINLDLVTESETMIEPITIVETDGIQMAQAMVGSQPRQYWSPVVGFDKNQVALMQYKIYFTVYYTDQDTGGLPITNNKLIIMSNHNNKRYYLKVPVVEIGVMTEVNVTVSEENLMDDNVTRGELLMALTDAMVFIPASYYDRMHLSSIGNLRYEIAAPDGTGEQAVASERCSCPTGYEGQSCEKCARGYMRENGGVHEYLGTCTPCACNNHATECDPETGECIDCQHNTQGHTCNECKTGYYGLPEIGTAFDCVECPCFQPRVINATCTTSTGLGLQCSYCADGYRGNVCDECDDFYYGNPGVPIVGKCEPCFCNSNTDLCNRQTGQCINCLYNTTGFNCEHCTDGYFGNASTQACNDCECEPLGSESTICDRDSGQCLCFPGVGGRKCDTCLPDHYGFTNTSFQGCTSCECNEFGSVQTQCDEAGKCTCAANVEGSKCSQCSSGYWGLPTQTCQVCGCDSTGTVDPSAPCDPITGQCVCKPGVDGRTCDRCQFLHINFGENGCTTCNECQYSMGNDTRDLEEQMLGYWSQMQMIGEVQMLDSEMQQLALLINQTSSDLGIPEGQLNNLTSGLAELEVAAPRHNQTVEVLLSRLTELDAMSKHVDNASMGELARQEAFQSTADEAHKSALTLNSSTPPIVDRLTSYITNAEQLYADSSGSSHGMDVNFDKEKAVIEGAVSNISQTAARADRMLTDAHSTGNITSYLTRLTAMAKAELLDIEENIKDTTTIMNVVKNKADAVWNDFNTTQYYRMHAIALFTEAETLIAMSEAILSDSQVNSQLALQLLTDTDAILNGVSSGPLPVDPTIVSPGELTGIQSWNQASERLNILINVTHDELQTKYEMVDKMELMARNLTTHVQALTSEFERVKPHGEKAVEVIKNYEAVARTLAISVDMALDANRTISLIIDSLKRVSVTELQEQSQNSLLDSQTVLNEFITYQANTEDLHQRLRRANASLTSAIAQWDAQYKLSSAFLQAAESIHQLALEPLVAVPIEDAYIATDAAIQTADIVISQDGDFQPQIQAQVAKAELIREENQNVTNLVTSLNDKLDNFEHVMDNEIQTHLVQAERLKNDTTDTRSTIELKMAGLEAKLERARLLLLKMEQPVGLKVDEHEEVPNPIAGQAPATSNELILEFQVYLEPQGILFFTENNLTEEVLMLHFVEEQLVFEFTIHEESLRITSRASICAGCWFRVIATRFGIDGHLTLIRMADGGIATNHGRVNSLHNLISLNTPIYIGGLPSDYGTTKVSSEDGNFAGCVYNAHLDGHKLPLWKSMVEHTSTAQCCMKPTQPPRPPTISPGCYCFSGFDASQIPSANFSIAVRSYVQFHFRTFDESGVLLLVDKSLSASYYGIFLREGKVVFEYGGLGWRQELKSEKIISDGKWYQLTAMHNQTYSMLVVENVDKANNTAVDVKSISSVGQDMSVLNDGTLTFGGQNPESESHGPVVDFFAGCMKEVSFMRADDFTISTMDILPTTTGVSDQYCYKDVIPGIGFTATDSYARLTVVRRTISNVGFSFQTYEPSGILVFGQRPEGRPPYFYIAIYNGDILVLINQGRGLRPVLRTRGLYLSDGLEHSVSVDFSIQNDPRLSVDDGPIHHGTQTGTTPNVAIAGGAIFIAGVPVNLPSQLPVHSSLIGGLRNLMINGQLIDVYDPSQFAVSDIKLAWLSGLPLPLDEPPPPPYSTTPAPPTTPHPTCTSPLPISFSESGLRFGNEKDTFAAFDFSSQQPDLFRNSFTITVEFRAVQPNGILVYAASSSQPEPTYYFCLFLQGGKLVYVMESNSKTEKVRMKVDSNKSDYNRGEWVEVTVLRINDFIALVVTKDKDYKNNQVASGTPSFLTINTNLYVGGVPNYITGLPFGIMIGNQGFHGCIKRVEVATHNPESINFDLTAPIEDQGTVPCFDSAQPGIFLNDSDASIRLSTSVTGPTVFHIVPGTKFNLTLHGASREGLLLVAFKSSSQFFMLELYDGEIRGVLTGRGDSGVPFEFSSKNFLGAYAVCDGAPHTVEVTLTISAALLKIDQTLRLEFPYPAGFLFPEITAIPIYIGRHGDLSPESSYSRSMTSYHGCISDFFLDDREYVLAEMADTRGTFSGCPGLPDNAVRIAA